MKISVRNKNDHKVYDWAGGTSTQLLICPEDAEYEIRNFQWRISSARVELEESTFTLFPQYHRILMVIEGNLRIEHEGYYSILLGPFQQDQFKGEWITKSHGRAVDFNLIMDGSCFGDIETFYIQRHDILSVPKLKAKENCRSVTESFYIVKGSADIKIGKNIFYSIQKGALVFITRAATEAEVNIKIENLELKELVFIRTIVYY